MKKNVFVQRHAREKRGNIISFIVLIVLMLIVIFPIYWIFRSSLMTNGELYAYPPAFTPPEWRFENYAATLKEFPFWKYLGNTLTIIVPSVFGAVVTATMGGYAFARLHFRGKKLLFAMCVSSMLLPSMVMLIPQYVAWTRILGAPRSYWPQSLPHFCGGGAFNIFLIRQFVMTVPRELDDAAKIDGCGYVRILWNIIVPCIAPAMITVGLLKFVELWNDLLQQVIYINSTDKFTIALGLSLFKGSLKSDWSKIMCATCLAFIPGVVIYLIGQKHFVEGITTTGMKN